MSPADPLIPAATPPLIAKDVAVVVIGRNEGERLRRCLTSLAGHTSLVVYVDSGSTDGSVDMAQSLGVTCVPLDLSIPFTAARARNMGFNVVLKLNPDVALVQFIDGDTEMSPTWLETAHQFMAEHPSVAAVFGRRRERHPDASIYNQLCDLEWAVPAGVSLYCGGDVMIRRKAFEGVNGYTNSLIAGEESDLCVRMRHHGWLIQCIDAEMTLHDAAILRFDQWWKRTTRSGFAFAEGAKRFGGPPDFHWIREARRTLLWGLLMPMAALAMAFAFDARYLWLLLIYPAQILRVYVRSKGPSKVRWMQATFYLLARFPETMGLLKFHLTRVTGRRQSIIEYK